MLKTILSPHKFYIYGIIEDFGCLDGLVDFEPSKKNIAVKTFWGNRKKKIGSENSHFLAIFDILKKYIFSARK